MRKVNKEFPRISLSNFQGMKHIDYFKKVQNRLKKDLTNMRVDKFINFVLAMEFKEKLKAIIEPIKKDKIGNCTESANLTTLALKINGIKNCQQAILTTKDGEDFDHSIVIVNDEKPYIVDAWLGFADYVPNAIKRYQKEFRHHFDFEKIGTEEMVVSDADSSIYTATFVNQDFTDKELKTIKRMYPELVLK